MLWNRQKMNMGKKPKKPLAVQEVTFIAYKQATWDFLMEHCDVLENGTMFVKFHMTHRGDLEKRINARARGYHREDVRSKEQEQLHRANATQKERRIRRDAWNEEKIIRERRHRRWGWLKILGIKI